MIYNEKGGEFETTFKSSLCTIITEIHYVGGWGVGGWRGVQKPWKLKGKNKHLL